MSSPIFIGGVPIFSSSKVAFSCACCATCSCTAETECAQCPVPAKTPDTFKVTFTSVTDITNGDYCCVQISSCEWQFDDGTHKATVVVGASSVATIKGYKSGVQKYEGTVTLTACCPAASASSLTSIANTFGDTLGTAALAACCSPAGTDCYCGEPLAYTYHAKYWGPGASDCSGTPASEGDASGDLDCAGAAPQNDYSDAVNLTYLAKGGAGWEVFDGFTDMPVGFITGICPQTGTFASYGCVEDIFNPGNFVEWTTLTFP